MESSIFSVELRSLRTASEERSAGLSSEMGVSIENSLFRRLDVALRSVLEGLTCGLSSVRVLAAEQVVERRAEEVDVSPGANA